jgi:hypothetical protein
MMTILDLVDIGDTRGPYTDAEVIVIDGGASVFRMIVKRRFGQQSPGSDIGQATKETQSPGWRGVSSNSRTIVAHVSVIELFLVSMCERACVLLFRLQELLR